MIFFQFITNWCSKIVCEDKLFNNALHIKKEKSHHKQANTSVQYFLVFYFDIPPTFKQFNWTTHCDFFKRSEIKNY
jgi:hypothetical protein